MAGDYLKLLENRLGVAFERVKGLSWQEAYTRLQRHEIDMTTSVAVTPERTQFWLFTKPYMKIPIAIFAQADVTYIDKMRELSGKRVAIVDGYAVNDWIPKDFPEIRLVKAKNAEEGLELLQRGEVFAYIDNMLVVSYSMAKLKMANIKIAGETPYVNAQSMAVRSDWPILAGILQKGLDSISEKEHAEIYRKWLPVRYEHGINYRLLWQVLALFVVILSGLGVWNRKLFREIKHRKEAELALGKSEELFRNLFEVAPIPLCLVNKEGVLVNTSRLFSKVFGYSSEEVPTLNEWWQLAYPDPGYRGWVLETWEAALQRGPGEKMGIEPFEYRITCKNGEIRTVLISHSRIGDNFLAGFLDITERKQTEEDREILQSQLVQAQKMESVGRLAGGVAHDFNNMLSVILGYSELAMDKVNPSDPLHKDLREILNAASRSTAIVRQLLAFARKQTIAPKILDLNETVEGMLKMLRRLIGEDIDLAWLPGKVVGPVRMDPSQMDQILANLCVNARDAIADVGKITIETGKASFDEEYCADHAGFVPGDYVLLAVSDKGCGMGKEVLAHLFEPFFTTKEPGGGTGLGLATVYGIVKQNNGFINVYSEQQIGTTFKIYLPRHQGEGAAMPLESTSILPRGQGEHILIVEDEGAILALGKTMLENLGYTVFTAKTPEEALRLAKIPPGKIHLLITDVVMPGMNGRDLAEEMMLFYPDLKVLFMSGYTANVIAHHGVLDAGVHFIQKPFSKKDIAMKVRETLFHTKNPDPPS